jgi:hypothetical protein
MKDDEEQKLRELESYGIHIPDADESKAFTDQIKEFCNLCVDENIIFVASFNVVSRNDDGEGIVDTVIFTNNIAPEDAANVFLECHDRVMQGQDDDDIVFNPLEKAYEA